MKVSLQTVKYYLGDKQLPYSSVDELVQKIGAQLGAVEEVTDFGKRYDGIYMVEVMSCVKHHDADKLSICLIDDGGVAENVDRDENGYVQVVCGAPNVREGLYVAWIPPGVTVPATVDKDPFILEKREIRGVLSNGMLASASELAINNDHSGLLEIDINGLSEDDVKPGNEFKKLFGLDDVVLDIENKMFTHRPDCFGVLGVAREIFGIYQKEFESPDWYKHKPNFEAGEGLGLTVDNQIPELVPRFMAVAIKDVQIGPSPIWLQALLTRIGVKPINNVVDLTNFISYLTAQPLHAYDYDKVATLSDGDAKIVVRLPLEGEQVALLNGKSISPRKEAIMIATDKELIGLGGVMGGTSTEVDEQTKNIIIECANFDMYSIRRTSMEHGLFTDAVTRFTKGQSPLQNDRVLQNIMLEVYKYAGGQQASNVIDNVSFSTDEYNSQLLSADFINTRLGLSLSQSDIASLLRNVEFEINEHGDEVRAPFWRTDIAQGVDIVEEVGRLYGFDKMPQQLPLRRVAPAVVETDLLNKSEVRNKLASLGANEVLNYTFVHGNLLAKANQNAEYAFKLSNALSPELEYYRLSLTPTLLSNVHLNIKSGYDRLALFEIGKVHGKSEIAEGGIPEEFGRAALVVADKANKSGAFFQARAYLDELFGEALSYQLASAEKYHEHTLFQQLLAPFEIDRSAFVFRAEKLIGVVGEYKVDVLRAFKLPRFTAGFEIFLSALKESTKKQYVPLSSYPAVQQDICYEISSDVRFYDYQSVFKSALAEAAGNDSQVEVSLLDIFQDAENTAKKRITFHVKFVSYERTLQESFVNKIVEDLDKLMMERLSATRI